MVNTGLQSHTECLLEDGAEGLFYKGIKEGSPDLRNRNGNQYKAEDKRAELLSFILV